MKGVSYLLAFLLVFLTIQPTIAFGTEKPETNCCGSSCCSEEEKIPEDTKQNKNDCSDQNCNPFQSCGCCIGFTVKAGFNQIQSPIVQQPTLVSKVESSISHYTPDVWQPPEIS